MLIYFCDSCRARIPNADMEAQSAVLVAENKALCAKCAAVRKSAITARVNIRGATRTGAARTSATTIRNRGSEAASAAALLNNLGFAIVVGCIGLLLFVIGLYVALRGGS